MFGTTATGYSIVRHALEELPNTVHYGVTSEGTCLSRLLLGPRPDGTYEENYLTIIAHERLDIEKRAGRRLENVRR